LVGKRGFFLCPHSLWRRRVPTLGKGGSILIGPGGDEIQSVVDVIGVEVRWNSFASECVGNAAPCAEQGVSFAVNLFQLFDNAALVGIRDCLKKFTFGKQFTFHKLILRQKQPIVFLNLFAIIFFKSLKQKQSCFRTV
jgi:hypothetical protein